ncbi:uncharacterized protein LOC108024176 [Drosophila biarmipes]|uniref:uncharacterized protein LOC108024176 n=1 Tax=Drosophila biarmipes TaxID=125945 RepID=UPI0007E76EA0|nr:uncharacterized protein LOC108024176 [Drosophila biarmipes]
MSKDNKKKLLAQRHVSSRMNYLYQASNLMAEGHRAKLAAYYGKLCRNVGTKAVMHMAPALKRSLCKRCSLPLLPGVNTELQVSEEPKEAAVSPPTQKQAPSSGEARTRKKRHRRQRKKPKRSGKDGDAGNNRRPQPETHNESDPISLYLKCSLCHSRRSFPADNQRDCWLEQPQSVVQVVSLPGENGQR